MHKNDSRAVSLQEYISVSSIILIGRFLLTIGVNILFWI